MVYFITIFIAFCFVIRVKTYVPIMKWNGKKMKISIQGMQNVLLLVLSAFPLFFLSAFRYGIGTDYFYTYYPHFLHIASGNKDDFYEVGFFWINKVVTWFSKNPQSIFIVTSFLFVVLVYRSMYRLSHNLQMSMILFILSYTYFTSLNNVRQSLASAVILLALDALSNDKVKGAIILTVTAGLIHQVAFLFMLLIILRKYKLSPRLLSMMSILAFCIVKALGALLIVIIKYINVPRLATYFEYSNLAIYLGKTLSIVDIFINFALMSIIIYLEMQNKKIKTINMIQWNVIKWSQFFCICICAFDGIVPATYRILRVFSFMQFILVPNILNEEQKKIRRIVLYVIVIILYMTLFLHKFCNGEEGIFPYVSIWNQ